MLVAIVTPARPAGLGDDLRFLLVVARVQHVVRDLALLELLRQRLRLLDRHRADQHRLLAFAALLDELDDGARLVGERAVDLVVGVLAPTATLVGISTTSSR
jgi:hypothetical protein